MMGDMLAIPGRVGYVFLRRFVGRGVMLRYVEARASR